MKLKNIFTIVFLLCSYLFGYGQEKRILISEEKKGKRIILMAENTTDETINIFLLVNAKGYRRSADKPILINVPPKRKIYLTTLIEIKGENSSYNYELIVNDTLDNDAFIRFEKAPVDIAIMIKNKLVLFTKLGCDRCNRLEEQLALKRIGYRSFNLDKDPILYKQFIGFIEKSFTEKTIIRFPVIWNKNEAIFGYDSLEEIMTTLAE
ncbi:MAG: glutaredoxin [Patiriisocius sp.]|jgi:glutaredoxin